MLTRVMEVYVKSEWIQEHDGDGTSPREAENEEKLLVHVKEEVEIDYEAATQDPCQHEVQCKLELGPEVLQPRDRVFVPPDLFNGEAMDIVKPEPLDTTITHTSFQDMPSPAVKKLINTGEDCERQLSKKHEEMQTAKLYTCSTCDRKCSDENALRNHLKTHTVYTCETCYKQFRTKPEFRRHKLSHATHVCEICKKLFTDKRYLISHVQRQHAQHKQKLTCKICNKQFSTEHNLAKHMKVHLMVKFTCKFCEKQFKNNFTLIEHEMGHTGEKRYPCEICMKPFKRMGRLNLHLRTCHTNGTSRLYTCDVCQRLFLHKRHLEEHIGIHMDELFGCNMENQGDSKTFDCNICDKKYTINSALVVHMRKHNSDQPKPFSCIVCEKKFAFKSFLISHMRFHTGEKPFGCDICMKTFSSASSLTQHIYRAHN